MNLTTTTAVTVALAFLASVSFATEASPSRPSGGKGKESKPDPVANFAYLSAAYGQIAPFDLNLNGELEKSELEQLAKAIDAGTVEMTPPPGRTPPADFTPPAMLIATRAAGMYAKVAIHDANADGVLSADELASLRTAIESGKLGRPGKGGNDAKGGRGRPATR